MTYGLDDAVKIVKDKDKAEANNCEQLEKDILSSSID